MYSEKDGVWTKCNLCGDDIFLNFKYGWTKKDEGTNLVICDTCLYEMDLVESNKE